MARKLYVGNLSYSASDEDLRRLFAPFGTVRFAMVVKDAATGRSRGFGFVEMATPEEAQAAVSAMHGHPAEGRPLTVNVARAKERGVAPPVSAS
jgi:cold-inducible RNA-binding protein